MGRGWVSGGVLSEEAGWALSLFCSVANLKRRGSAGWLSSCGRGAASVRMACGRCESGARKWHERGTSDVRGGRS